MTKRQFKKKQKKSPTAKRKEVGELRQDLVTGKWVVVATGRAKKPSFFLKERPKPKKLAKVVSGCPFCNLAEHPQKPDVLRLPDDPDEWEVHVFGNKYPAFTPTDEYRAWETGPYRAMESVGYHELLATRKHNDIDALLSYRQMELQLEALVLRYRQLKEKPSVSYIQIIKNHGEESGASLEHPHHQIFTVPVIPSDVKDIMQGAQNYTREKGHEVFGVIVDFELKKDERMLYENEDFVAFCPYSSRVPFEVWIVPKKPNPYFENTSPSDRAALAEIMTKVFASLYIGLNDPPYNYYILSAPCDDVGVTGENNGYDNFRWHIQVLPRLNTWGGFEMGTGLEITTALPEESAVFLREQKIGALLEDN